MAPVWYLLGKWSRADAQTRSDVAEALLRKGRRAVKPLIWNLVFANRDNAAYCRFLVDTLDRIDPDWRDTSYLKKRYVPLYSADGRSVRSDRCRALAAIGSDHALAKLAKVRRHYPEIMRSLLDIPDFVVTELREGDDYILKVSMIDAIARLDDPRAFDLLVLYMETAVNDEGRSLVDSKLLEILGKRKDARLIAPLIAIFRTAVSKDRTISYSSLPRPSEILAALNEIDPKWLNHASIKDSYLNRCLTPHFQSLEATPPPPEALLLLEKVRSLVDTRNYGVACQQAERLAVSFSDCADVYHWWGSALEGMGQESKARSVMVAALDRAREKHLLCRHLGQLEWKALDVRQAVYWWIQAIHCQESIPERNFGDDVAAYLFLHAIAQALNLPSVARSFLRRADDIRRGRERLGAEMTDQIAATMKDCNDSEIVEAVQAILMIAGVDRRKDSYYVGRCLTPHYVEETEARNWNDPAFQEVLSALNSGNYALVCQRAETLSRSHRGFATLYWWWGGALIKMGLLEQARGVLTSALPSVREKHILCSRLGEVEWKNGEFREAVYWWAQAVHCQESIPDRNFGGSEDAYLYLYYVSLGNLRASSCAEAFIRRVDQIRPGKVRLSTDEADRMVAIARSHQSETFDTVLVSLVNQHHRMSA